MPGLAQVEEVFAAGDLPRVAEILASMRRSLSLVGDVPEFRAGRQKLQVRRGRDAQQGLGGRGGGAGWRWQGCRPVGGWWV